MDMVGLESMVGAGRGGRWSESESGARPGRAG